MFHYRVKNLEPFKDGNILGGRFLKANETLVVSESDKAKLLQSGAALEVIEALVPNPLKKAVEEIQQEVEQEQVAEAPKRRRGRPRKDEK